MITNFFIPELNNHDVQELWFQQDGATCHTASATIDLLKDTFGDRLISRFGPVNWPPRSCDLTPLDYFLWGYVKSWSMRISHKRLTIWKTTFAVLLPIYGHKCWKKSSKIGRPDWTTSEPVLCQKSYLKCHLKHLLGDSFRFLLIQQYETVEVARIALRLPPFWKSNVRLWIAQCDYAFTFSGISIDDTKYSALVANLDAETLSYVSDIVLSPPNSDKYHTL
ncbi:uncharacterized protein TNCV_4955471 [Trichonephila clavipes]|nr:uncharacterized protein TNCV_4955471 [Trichonephila clavipes]